MNKQQILFVIICFILGYIFGYMIAYYQAINFCAEQAFKLLSFDNVTISFSDLAEGLANGRLRTI